MIKENDKNWLEKNGLTFNKEQQHYTNGFLRVGKSGEDKPWWAETTTEEPYFVAYGCSPEDAVYNLLTEMRKIFKFKLERTFKGVIFE